MVASAQAEADDYFADLIPAAASAEEAAVARQGIAGLMWGKQFYHFDVKQWLTGDPGSAPPPPGRRYGRNNAWWHMNSSTSSRCRTRGSTPGTRPGTWRSTCVTIARVDPGFAKSQLLLLLREWYMHPNGQIPAYEWAFGDVNPPVHAWAALRVFEIDGGQDHDFLARIMHKLLLNFTWWVNRKDVGGNNVFEGGFLGLDNVGPFDRSAALPVAGVLEQSDGTGWMAMYALNLLDMSIRLALHDRTYEDMATKFFEHFAYIAEAAYRQGLWDDEDYFFYDVLRLPDGHKLPLKARSIVGLLPLAATTRLSAGTLNRLPELGARLRWLLANQPEYADVISARRLSADGRQQRLLSMVGQDQLLRILARMLDPEEFLSEYGLRTLSRSHLEKPFTVSLGGSDFTVGYEPAESTSGLFGGNSNWRGPVWMPVNYLLIEALREFAAFYGDGPDGRIPDRFAGEDLADRGRRRPVPAAGVAVRPRLAGDAARSTARRDLFQNHPDWKDLIAFPEYFHGDNGAGLGAWHQTGWTALVVDLILTLHRQG